MDFNLLASSNEVDNNACLVSPLDVKNNRFVEVAKPSHLAMFWQPLEVLSLGNKQDHRYKTT